MPMVSIIVITYNSSKYVLETLESAKAQTYQNIELIISDDASQDDTVEICKKWLAENQDRFVRTKLIAVEKNTGISANCNRGVNVSMGEWIKLIAGDDILLEECIQDYINFIKNNQHAQVLFARVKFLKNNITTDDHRLELFDETHEKQKQIILEGSGLKAPSSFLKKSLLEKIGGFDEQYPMLEDVPMWVKLTLAGQKFYSTNTYTVKYRMHDSNISLRNKSDNYFNIQFYHDLRKFTVYELNPILKKHRMFIPFFHNLNSIIVSDLIILTGNKNNFLSKTLNLLHFKSSFNRLKKIFQ
jgi:glycosyltransferase involved in cell wall biosynthesis